MIRQRRRPAGPTLGLALLCLAGSLHPAGGQARRFQEGDLFVGVKPGKVQWRDSSGSLIATLETGQGWEPSGMGFDAAGNLYVVTCSIDSSVSRFAPDGASLGVFVSGLGECAESIVFDADGNFYVGHADGRREVVKFAADGRELDRFAVAREIRGSDWLLLDSDQRTLYYTSEGTRILSYDLAARTQLPHVTSRLHNAFALERLEDGRFLVADFVDIHLVSPDGEILRTYDTPDAEIWFGLAVAADRSSFWCVASGSNLVARFDIDTGELLQSFGTGGTESSGGAAVYREPLAAPAELSAVLRDERTVDLAWTDNSDDETGFEVWRRVDGGSFRLLASADPNTTRYADTDGIERGHVYTYRARAARGAARSSYSNEATVVHGAPPSAPTDLRAAAASASQIDLRWKDNSTDETGFRIERRGPTGGWAEIATVGADIVSHADTGLNPDTAYSYRVRAHLGALNSDYSNTASARTLPLPPAAPTDLSATAVSLVRVDLSWRDNSSNEDDFEAQRRTDGGAFARIALLPPGASSHSDDVEPGHVYTYRIRARNRGGESAFSNEATARTTVPARPTELTATPVASDRIDLAWTDNSDDETGFEVEQKIEDGSFQVLVSLPASTETYRNTGLTPNTTYTYRVRAMGALGGSPYSNEASARIVPPARPTDLVASPVSTSRIDLTWTDNSDDETGFELERKTGAGSFARIASLAADTGSYRNTGLRPRTTYTYRIRAVGALGVSAYSDEAATSTLGDGPPAPTDLTATAINSTRIRLNWRDNSTNEGEFRIERRTEGGSFQQVASVGVNSVLYTDFDLTPGTLYTYRIRASNNAGDSAYSNDASAVTPLGPPRAPSDLAAQVLSASSVLLTWKDNASDETGFKIERKKENLDFREVALPPENAASHTDEGLAANTTYTYRVRATNSEGDSAFTNTAAALTHPAPPADFRLAEAFQSRLDLAWTDGSPNPSRHGLERSVDGGTTFAPLAAIPAGTTRYSDVGLQPGTEYVYRLQSVNDSGSSAFAGPLRARTLDAPPEAPSDLTVTALSWSELKLEWRDRSGSEGGFEIERSEDGGQSFSLAGTVAADVTSHTDTGLRARTTYHYRVRAVNSAGASAWTAGSGTTKIAPPAAPRSLTADALPGGKVRLLWQRGDDTEEGFRIERADEGGEFAPAGTAPRAARSFTDSGLQAKRSYVYRVAAFNEGGQSGYSNEARVKTAADGRLVVPSVLSFGSVKVRRAKTLSLAVRNGGEGPLEVTVGRTAAPFRVVSGAGTMVIEPGKSRSVRLAFRPVRKGRAKGKLELTSSDPKRPKAAVKLLGAGR